MKRRSWAVGAAMVMVTGGATVTATMVAKAQTGITSGPSTSALPRAVLPAPTAAVLKLPGPPLAAATAEPYQPVPAEKDFTRLRLLSRLRGSGPANAGSTDAERALRRTLALGGSHDGVVIGKIECHALGCAADVAYASPDAFTAFDKGKHGQPELPFDSWQGVSGRTGLLVDGARLIATWYFAQGLQ